jgi:hypothetical protein
MARSERAHGKDTSFDIRRIPRESLRIDNQFDPDQVQAALARFDEIDREFFQLVRSWPESVLTTRPKPGSWSILEHVRHLLFSNQLYIDHWMLGPLESFSPLGLAPEHLRHHPEFRHVGTAPDVRFDDVVATRAAIRSRLVDLAPDLDSTFLQLDGRPRNGPPSFGKIFQGLIWHDFGHFRYCDAIARRLHRPP